MSEIQSSQQVLKIPAIEDLNSGVWVSRAIRTMVRLLRHPILFWDDVYRGDGLAAPFGMLYAWTILGALFFLLMAKFGLDATHKSAGVYSGMLLVNFYTSFPAQVALFLLTPILEVFVFGGMVSAILRLFGDGDGTFHHTSRLSAYVYLAVIPLFATLIGISIYMSANPIGALNFFGAGDVLANPSAIRHSQILSLAVMVTFLVPGILLRVYGVIAIKRTLGSHVTWIASVVSGAVATITMWILTTVLGVAMGSLTVRWMLGLRREAPRSAVEKVILAPTQWQEPKPEPKPERNISELIRETGLEEPLVKGLLDLDDTLNLKDKWVNQFVVKMMRRYRKAYVEINKIYDDRGISQASPVRIPRLERVLRPSRPNFKQDTMQQIPASDQLRKANMVSYNCEKNMGAVCGGIFRVVEGQRSGSHCRHQGWEKMNDESSEWAARLKACNPNPKEIECLLKVRDIIDKLLEMEFNYTTNSRDYPD